MSTTPSGHVSLADAAYIMGASEAAARSALYRRVERQGLHVDDVTIRGEGRGRPRLWALSFVRGCLADPPVRHNGRPRGPWADRECRKCGAPSGVSCRAHKGRGRFLCAGRGDTDG